MRNIPIHLNPVWVCVLSGILSSLVTPWVCRRIYGWED